MKKLILFLFLSLFTLVGYAQTLTLGRGLTGGSYNGTGNVTTTFDTTQFYTWLKQQAIQVNSVGTTLMPGFTLINTTAATSGSQQMSPALRLGGQGFATTPGTSQRTDFYFQVNPIQGAATPSSTLQLLSSLNGGAPIVAFQFSSNSGFVTGTLIASPGGSGITSTDGVTLLNSTNATSSLNQWSRRLRWNGNGWNSTTTTSTAADWIAENKTFTGNPITSRLAFSSQIGTGGFTERFGMADNGLFYLNSTALTANQMIGANSGATGMEAKTLSGSSATGLTVTNGTGTLTFSNDTTKLQTVANFFPKGDTRYISGANANTFTAEQTIQRNNILSTQTNALTLTNTQAAVNLGQQISPSLHLSGRGYASTSGTSQPVDFYFQVVPTQGTANPTGLLQILSSVNSATPVSLYSFNTSGIFVAGVVATTHGGIGVTSGDGFTTVNATAATSSLVQWSARNRWSGNAWNTSSSASQEVDAIAELKTFSGNPVSGRWALSTQVNTGGYTERFGVADNGLWYINATALAANQIIGANSGATGMEAKTLSGSSATGLTVSNGTGTLTFSNDTSKLQTIANFFPKADGRYLKTSTAASTYQPLLGYTAANDANVVHLTGNENIAGTKTFTDKLAIGTSTVPTGYQFAVNGSSIATSITVKAHTNWPDYVFASHYQLMPLGEVDEYVKTNHHLPGMPTAAQIAKDGQDLGEMNAKLLKQVEELTLYLLEKDKQLKAQQVTIESQEERLKRIEKQLNISNGN